MLNFLQSAPRLTVDAQFLTVSTPPSLRGCVTIRHLPQKGGGSISPRDVAISLDSGSRYAARRASGMTGFMHYDTVSYRDGRGRNSLTFMGIFNKPLGVGWLSIAKVVDCLSFFYGWSGP